VLHQPISGDARHHVVGMVDALSAIVAQREGQSVADLFSRSEAKVGLGRETSLTEPAQHPKGPYARLRDGIRVAHSRYRNISYEIVIIWWTRGLIYGSYSDKQLRVVSFEGMEQIHDHAKNFARLRNGYNETQQLRSRE
jgi:hypothetical protein